MNVGRRDEGFSLPLRVGGSKCRFSGGIKREGGIGAIGRVGEGIREHLSAFKALVRSVNDQASSFTCSERRCRRVVALGRDRHDRPRKFRDRVARDHRPYLLLLVIMVRAVVTLVSIAPAIPPPSKAGSPAAGVVPRGVIEPHSVVVGWQPCAAGRLPLRVLPTAIAASVCPATVGSCPWAMQGMVAVPSPSMRWTCE